MAYFQLMLLETIFLVSILNDVVNAAGDPEIPISHSLMYIYMELSKNLSSLGFFEFISLGLLDNRQIYYYDSTSQVQVPKPDWVQAGLPDYTEELQNYRGWFRHQSDVLGNCTWPCSDLHVLQRRYGCEVQKHQNGSIDLLRTFDEYGYDGEDFITFDPQAMQWKAEVPKAQMTKMIWDNDKGRILDIRIYLENECVDILNKSLMFRKGKNKTNALVDVYIFAKRAVSDPGKLTLTCLTTGFYPKKMMMSVRKYRTSLPEVLIMSSEVRPNDDDTYQLRKSVDILESEKADYDCYVTHSSLTEPVITKWDGKCNDCSGEKIQSAIIGGVFGVLLTLAVVGVIICIVIRTGVIVDKNWSKGPRRYQPPNDDCSNRIGGCCSCKNLKPKCPIHSF
ncbi:zinc-alpha-2-glycoprotein-like isoform X1 [Electrophorus electricus]|uniref:Immunoglobulin C1-set domain-containing protein n=1 Tax=Electrophorus electricus TaxID=8005 RepID=A0A4W4E2T2_ELEEL|nr:zinc-alpha-2-glycoprotein-like isoform X1 [Electrophorus electricus]